MTLRRAALIAVVLAGPAFAGTTEPATDAAKPDRKPVPAYGDDHPECDEWTDGCIVCVREADGPACSMPGIACLPAEEPECRTTRR